MTAHFRQLCCLNGQSISCSALLNLVVQADLRN